jgi:hypothetical protein
VMFTLLIFFGVVAQIMGDISRLYSYFFQPCRIENIDPFTANINQPLGLKLIEDLGGCFPVGTNGLGQLR